MEIAFSKHDQTIIKTSSFALEVIGVTLTTELMTK